MAMESSSTYFCTRAFAPFLKKKGLWPWIQGIREVYFAHAGVIYGN